MRLNLITIILPQEELINCNFFCMQYIAGTSWTLTLLHLMKHADDLLKGRDIPVPEDDVRKTRFYFKV